MIFITNESELKFGEGISALYFYADWLNYHKKMKIMIEKIEESYQDIKFYAIDIDDFKIACRRFNVNSIPTIIITKDGGKEMKRIIGLTLTSAFRKTFADIYKSYGEKDDKEKNENTRTDSK